MNLALIGHGTMGRLIGSLAARRGYQIVHSIDSSDADAAPGTLAAAIRGCDAVIDFSFAGAVPRNVEACMLAGVPLVEGTTGWSEQKSVVERIVRDNEGAFVFGANFSVGVNLFYRIADHAAQLFSRFSEYEAFIEERHHSRKKDAPSGTALKLKEIVAKHIGDEFSISSTRAGNIPGTHLLGFDGATDHIVLEHTARSREGFAAGALMAAEWIVGKKGFFEFGDVMDEILGRKYES